MKHVQVAVPGLPDNPLDAAQDFYKSTVPMIREILAQGLPEAPGKLEELDLIIVLFPSADHTHRAWRTAVTQELAREAAPVRINSLAGGSAAAVDEMVEFLSETHGVTGQLLAVDGKSGESR